MTRHRRRAAALAFVLAAVVLAPSSATAWRASHPKPVKEQEAIPSGFAAYWTADRAQDVDLWSAAPASGQPVIVMIHGYRQARSDLQRLAEHLHDRGYGIVLAKLPYVDGSESYSGGTREAKAVRTAVDWTNERFKQPVVLTGFSAGGFASARAVDEGANVSALITDSAFVDAAATFRQVASERIHLPHFAFFALRPAYYLSSDGGSLKRVTKPVSDTPLPAFVIHGAADDYVSPSNAHELQSILSAQLWIVDGANHGRAWYANPQTYEDRIDTFIKTAIPH